MPHNSSCTLLLNFNEGDYGGAVDTSVNARTTTNSGAYVHTSGAKYGTSGLLCGGSSGSPTHTYLSVNSPAGIFSTSGTTGKMFDVFFRPDFSNPNGTAPILSLQFQNGDSMHIAHGPTNIAVEFNGQIHSTGNYHYISNAFYPNFGQWYHVRVFISGTKIRFWVDGYTPSYSTHTSNIWVNSPITEVLVGAYPSSFSNTTAFFCGAINHVYFTEGDNLWNRDVGFCPPLQEWLGYAPVPEPYNEATKLWLKPTYDAGNWVTLSYDESRWRTHLGRYGDIPVVDNIALYGDTLPVFELNGSQYISLQHPTHLWDMSLPQYYSRELRMDFCITADFTTEYHYFYYHQYALSNYGVYFYYNGPSERIVVQYQNDQGNPQWVGGGWFEVQTPGIQQNVMYTLRVVIKDTFFYVQISNGTDTWIGSKQATSAPFDYALHGELYTVNLFGLGNNSVRGGVRNIIGLEGDESWFGGTALPVAFSSFDDTPAGYIPETRLLMYHRDPPLKDSSEFFRPYTEHDAVTGFWAGLFFPRPTYLFNHMVSPSTPARLEITYPNTVCSTQSSDYVTRDIELFFRPEMTTIYDILFHIKFVDGGGILGRMYGEYVVAIESTDQLGNSTLATAQVQLPPIETNSRYLRIQIYQRKIQIFYCGHYRATLDPGWDVWYNGATISSIQIGSSTDSGNYYRGQMSGFAIYENLPVLPLGRLITPILQREPATEPGPRSISVPGILQSFANGAFQLGVPISVSVPGITQDYEQQWNYQYTDPSFRSLDRRQGGRRLLGRHFALGSAEIREFANSFWEIPPTPSANVSLSVAGTSYTYTVGALTASNPGRNASLSNNTIAYNVGAVGINIVSYSPSVAGVVMGYALPTVSTAVAISVGLVGSTYGYSIGSVSVQKSVTLTSAVLAFPASTLSPTLSVSQGAAVSTFSEFGDPPGARDIVQYCEQISAIEALEFYPDVSTRPVGGAITFAEVYPVGHNGLAVRQFGGGTQGVAGVSPVAVTETIDRHRNIPFAHPTTIRRGAIDIPSLTVGITYSSVVSLSTTDLEYGVKYAFPVTYAREKVQWSIDFTYSQFTIINYWQHDLSYALDVGAGVALRTWSIDVRYSMAAYPTHTRAFDIAYGLLLPQQVTWQIDLSYGLGLSEWQIDMLWWQTPSQYMTEILALVNAERAAVGRTKMYRLYDEIGPDVATRHADNERNLHIYSHDSDLFPVGWRTVPERAQRLDHPNGGMSENLQIWWSDLEISHPTPLQVFDIWKNSPPHYANMIAEWPESADVGMLIGAAYGGAHPVYLGDGVTEVFPAAPANSLYTYFVQNFIDMNLPGGGLLMQFTFNMKWTSYGAPLMTVPMAWGLDAYKHVAARHSGAYDIKLSAQHNVLYGCRVAAAHAAPQHFTVSAAHEAEYGQLIPVTSSHAGSYDVRQYGTVVTQHATIYGLRVSRAYAATYEDTGSVASSHTAIYQSLEKIGVAHDAQYSDAGLISAAHTAPYAIRLPVAGGHSATYSYNLQAKAQHAARYADQVRVTKQVGDSYDLLVNQPVKKSQRAFYNLRGADTTEMVDLPASLSVTINGAAIDYSDAEVSTSEDEFVWTGKVTLTDPNQYATISVDDPMVVSIGGVSYALIVTGKTLGRSGPADVDMEVTGTSKNVELTEPRASAISYTLSTPKMASAIAVELVGRPVIWQIVDWLIPATYFAVESVTPISALQTIANAAGGIVVTNPAGDLVVRYKFPVSVTTYEVATPHSLLTDSEDNLSCSETINTTDVVNRLRIRNSAGEASDRLEFVQDENVDDTGTLKAYVMPWRPVEVKHTGGAVVFLGPQVLETRTETALVEIVDGKASLQYPAVSITGVVWKSDPLGTLSVDPRTMEVTASDKTTNYGYGLAEITYVVECYTYRVQFPVGNVAQFILIDRG